jgi:flagellar biosynthesis/type III secretory pathway protein FliH
VSEQETIEKYGQQSYDNFMEVNTKYKDSVFSFLFSNPDALRELYSALEGVTLPPDAPVSINTLSDVLYMGQVNDISFTIDNRLVVLLEHQSTINPNMPLRLLIYIARVYEKIIDRRKAYRTGLEKIPSPEFIVLYNGVKPYPERAELRLSDAFKDAADLKSAAGSAAAGSSAALELVVKVYNINKGYNTDLARKSRTLEGYSEFVERIRENGKTMAKEESVKAAIKQCIERNILRTFLETNSSEVMNMLITEWDLDEAIAVNREEAWAEGREEGYEEGRGEGYEEGRGEGYEEGRGEGREEGLEMGREESEKRIIELWKSGKSLEEVIKTFGSS